MTGRVVSAAIFGLTLSVLSTGYVVAKDSQLEQQILPQDCNYTTVETGSGVVNDIDCPTFPPVVSNVDVNDGRPVIIGVYDAIHTEELKVWVNGRWYVYGVDSELTTNGNVWKIDLSQLTNPLPAGDYELIVETTDQGDIKQSSRTNFTVDTKKSDDGGAGEIFPGIPNTGVARVGIFSSLLATVAVFLLLFIFKRRKSNSSRDKK